MSAAQMCFEGMETLALKPSWRPTAALRGWLRSFFLGFHAHKRECCLSREYIRRKLLSKGIKVSLRTIDRCLHYFSQVEKFLRITRRGPHCSRYEVIPSGESFGETSGRPSLLNEVKTEAKPKTSTEAVFLEAERTAIESHIQGCGLKAEPVLLEKLNRQARHYRVNGFRIAAAIERAWRKVRGTSNAPRSPGWVTVVVENELRGSGAGQNVAIRQDKIPPCELKPLNSERWDFFGHCERLGIA